MSGINKKAEVAHYNHSEDYPAKSDVDAPSTAGISPDDFGFTPEEQRKIIKKVDYRLVITVGAM